MAGVQASTVTGARGETMTPYLATTRLCDCDSVRVKDRAKDIVGVGKDETQAALSIFYFVREGVLFGVDYPDTKASVTLDHGLGYCQTKTNLQMALLRASGIPSRCHLVQLPKANLRPLVPRFGYDRMPDVVAHPWCECFLSGRWVACEANYDSAFYQGMLRLGLRTCEETPTIEWDGNTDLILEGPWIIEDMGTYPSWDAAMEEARNSGAALPTANRLLGWFLLSYSNKRILEIRKSSVP